MEAEPFKAPKAVVLISGSGSNLQTLIDQIESKELNMEIAAVISNEPEAHGLVRAQNVNIKTHAINHREFAQRELFDVELIRVIDRYQADIIILAGFMRILSSDFVRRYQGKLLNIHPSLLPKYPGLHTHQRAIENGDKIHGVTVHFVVPELDAGPNIIQAEVPVLSNDTPQTLAARVQAQEHVIYPIAVKWFAEGRLQLQDGKSQLDHVDLPISGLVLDSPHTLH
jgi:phosphoribosylglycinamide formyltransferase-1